MPQYMGFIFVSCHGRTGRDRAHDSLQLHTNDGKGEYDGESMENGCHPPQEQRLIYDYSCFCCSLEISLIGSRRYGDGLVILEKGLMGGHDWKQCCDSVAYSIYLAAIHWYQRV